LCPEEPHRGFLQNAETWGWDSLLKSHIHPKESNVNQSLFRQKQGLGNASTLLVKDPYRKRRGV
jgi:hypothetical protein